MKRLIILMIGFVAYFGSVKSYAQDAGKPAKEWFSYSKKYMNEGNIDEATQTKILAFIKESNAEIKALKENTSLSEDEKAAKLKDLQTTRGKTIQGFLTDEQKESMKTVAKRVKDTNTANGY